MDVRGIVGSAVLSKKQGNNKRKRVVESSLSSAPDTNMEHIDISSKKDPMPEINEEAGEEEENEARGNGSKKEEKDQSSSSDEDQWEAKMDDVPKKKAVPKAAFKKVPE